MGEMIAVGVPWCALGRKSLFSDSGFVSIYEMFKWQSELFGQKSMIVLDPGFKDKFEEYNDPEKTGIWPIYNRTSRSLPRSYDGGIDGDLLNKYFVTGLQCPVDYVFTNKRLMTSMLALWCDDRYSRYRVPVYLQPTTSGKEGFNAKVPMHFKYKLMMEAFSYAMAYRVFWGTTEQRDRGFAISRQFLAPITFKEVKDHHRIIGVGITTLARPYALSDDEICKRLQSPKKDFRVSFVGRMNAVKNVSFIIDSLRALFAKYNIQLEVVSTGALEMPKDGAFKKHKDARDAKAIIGHHETGGTKGRDYYASQILPNLQCGISATLTECHPSTPREAISVGVPWLIPANRRWGPALFGKDYPFLYNGEAEMMSLVQRIRKGKITDDECKLFLKIRGNRENLWFMDDVARSVHATASEDIQHFLEFSKPHNFDRIIGAFKEWVDVGEEFQWRKLPNIVARMGGGTIADRPQQRNLFDVYTRLREMIQCINPVDGIFKRLE